MLENINNSWYVIGLNMFRSDIGSVCPLDKNSGNFHPKVQQKINKNDDNKRFPRFKIPFF